MRRARRAVRPLERSAERRFVRYVEADGGVTRKMSGLGFNGWPDRQCFKPHVERSLFIEFKRLGKGATAVQREAHKRLRRLGQRVVVCDTYEKAVRAYERHH